MGNYINNIIRPLALLFIVFFTAADPLNSATVINPDAPGVTGTKHNLSMYGPGSVQAKTTTEICVFCHTPHSSRPGTPLWNRQDSGTTYTIYGTATLTINNTMGQPTGSSRLCLSCHDGTIAIGSLLNAPGAVLAQTLEMQGVDSGTGALTTTSAANIGTDISNDHPVSFSYSSSYPLNTEIKDPGPSGDSYPNIMPTVLDKSGNVQCASCHDPHTRAYPKFLRAALNPGTVNYGAQLCTLCHNKEYWNDSYVPVHREENTFRWTVAVTAPNPWEPHDFGGAVPATTISGSVNAAALTIPVTSTIGFPTAGRIKVGNELIDYTGTASDSFTGATRAAAGTTAMDYPTGTAVTGSDYSDDTLKMHGCLSCHRSHGGAVGKQLLKGRDKNDGNQPMVGEEWTCLNCHDGSMTKGTDSIKNIEAVLDSDTSANKHNTKGVYGAHKSERFATGTPAVRESPTNLDTNRHAECQDCHNTHDLKGGNHTVGGLYGVTSGNRIGNNLIGAWGVKPTSWPLIAGTSPSGPDGYTTLKLTDPATSLSFESYICIKCHSSYAYEYTPLQLSNKFPNSIGYESDPVADFNINNNGFHPVFENAGKNQPGIGDNPNWTDPYGLGLSNTFKCATEGTGNCATGVQYTSTITCSDCHGNSNFAATDPKGPHGSANKYILRSNETGTGSTKNFCYNCHRRDVYGDEGYCPPNASYSRVSHPPDEGSACIGTPTSPFYKTGTNLGNASNKFGILCISCHGGGEKTQNGNSVIDGIHGSHTLAGGYGADELGKRLMTGACVVGHTHATKIPVAGVTLWFKPDLTSDKVCNYNASTDTYAPYAETTCVAAGDEDGDGFHNDGCPSVGAAPETDAQCLNNTEDDGDGAVNDGCPAVAVGNAANYDYWPAPWP